MSHLTTLTWLLSVAALELAMLSRTSVEAQEVVCAARGGRKVLAAPAAPLVVCAVVAMVGVGAVGGEAVALSGGTSFTLIASCVRRSRRWRRRFAGVTSWWMSRR